MCLEDIYTKFDEIERETVESYGQIDVQPSDSNPGHFTCSAAVVPAACQSVFLHTFRTARSWNLPSNKGAFISINLSYAMDSCCKLFDPTAGWQFLITHTRHVAVTVKTGGRRVVRLHLGSSLASFASLHCVTSLVPTPESSGCWFITSPSNLDLFFIYLWFI